MYLLKGHLITHKNFSTEIKDTAPENSTSNKSAALIEVLDLK